MMNRPLIALWFTLVIAILALSVFAMMWWSQRQSTASQRLQRELSERLRPLRNQVTTILENYQLDFERQLAKQDADNGFVYGAGNADLRLTPTSWMPLQRDPRIQQLVVLDSDKRLIYPASLASMSEAEQSFVRETIAIIKDGRYRKPELTAEQSLPIPLNNRANSSESQQVSYQASQLVQTNSGVQQLSATPSQAAFPNQTISSSPGGSGWTAWYYGRWMVIGFWSQYTDGTLAMLTIPRSRLLADIIAVFPSSDTTNNHSLYQIVDSYGEVLHQWGQTDLAIKAASDPSGVAALQLDSPLESIQLKIYADRSLQRELAPAESPWPMVAAIASLSGVLLLLGFQSTLAMQREMRLARQQVSFVNQVSHELRTPLTNISMYTELAQSMIDPDSQRAEDAQLVAKLNVIHQESGRLNRLINNVLQAARSGNHKLRYQSHSIDTIVEHSLSLFRPRFEEKQIQIETSLACPMPVLCDGDAIEQIVVNLISNAEKYAGAGKYIAITTSRSGDRVTIQVRDRGPGIASSIRNKIFKPFVRADHGLESPSGTGIGLSIARQLARKHGGDCILVPSNDGACFECSLNVKDA